MRIVAVGVGGAGGRIVDSLWRDNRQRENSYLSGACVFDTDTVDLQGLHAVPSDNRHVFGQALSDGTGLDGNRTDGVDAITEERLEVRRAIDPFVTSDVDAIILVGGLAGGTGGGALPHVAKSLREVYDRPLYALSVLPAGWDEAAAWNTVQTLKPLGATVDAQLLFDNEAWLGSGQTVENSADELNEVVATRLGALFAAGEASESATVGQSVVDASEIINTLADSAVATIGYGTQTVAPAATDTEASLLGRLRNFVSADEPEDVDEVQGHKAIESTLRRAVRGKLTVECPRETTDKALCVFGGPPEWLIQDAITDGLRWLEDELQSPEIRSGDMPARNRDSLSVLVLLSGVSEVPRLDELETLAAGH